MRMKRMSLYTGLGSLFSFFLSIISGMFATKPFVVLCYGDMCEDFDPTWRDIFEKGTPRYYLAGIGEVMSHIFFYIAILCFIIFCITLLIKWLKR